ncbi:MAG: hypothetical protein K6T29_00270 [Peptococcaceae bacterium]|nr:hypothetical protein [Peptococcaceae bacterium]
MASIIKKKIKGQIYYYAAESRRVDGKPRIVWQKYLGKVGDIVAAVTSAGNLPAPKSAKIYSFGAEAALLGIARRLAVREIINKHAGRMFEDLDPGEYILTCAISSCTNPGARMADWFAGTVLRRQCIVNTRQLTEKRYLEVAGLLTGDVLGTIQRDLAGRICTEFGIGTRCLIYHNITLPGPPAAGALQSEQANPKIGLLVSSDFFVPLFYEIYRDGFSGPAPEKKYTDRLIECLQTLGRPAADVTVVKHLCSVPAEINRGRAGAQYRILGELAGEDSEDLLAIPLERFHLLKKNRRDKVMVYRCARKISGENTTVLVVFSEKEMRKQLEALQAGLHKCINQLVELQACLQMRRAGEAEENMSLSLVEKRVEEILSNPLIKSMVDVSLDCDRAGRVNLSFAVKENPLTPARERNLGKRIIFTTNNNWDNEEIYNAFRGRWELEEVLRAAGKPGPGSPGRLPRGVARRGLDVFCTVLGLTLQTLLQRELHRYGIAGSIAEILQTLSGIREVAVIYAREDQRVKKREYITLTQLDPRQREIYECLHLKQFEAGT